MKMESLNQRKVELEKKENQLKESVIKFDKFLKVKILYSRNILLWVLGKINKLKKTLIKKLRSIIWELAKSSRNIK